MKQKKADSLLASSVFIAYTAVVCLIITSIKKPFKKIKEASIKASKLYIEKNPNVIPFSELTKEKFKLDKSTLEKGEKANKFYSKFKNSNTYVEYSYKGKVVFASIYDSNPGLDKSANSYYLINMDSDFKKHTEYYFAMSAISLGFISREIEVWTSKLAKEYDEKQEKLTKESVNNTKLNIYESYNEGIISKEECDYLLESVN